MEQRTQIFIDKIAEFLNDLVDSKDIDPDDLIDKGLTPDEIEAVLDLGEEFWDYNISTFVRVLSVLNVHLEFACDMEDRNNFDMIGKSPSEN